MNLRRLSAETDFVLIEQNQNFVTDSKRGIFSIVISDKHSLRSSGTWDYCAKLDKRYRPCCWNRSCDRSNRVRISISDLNARVSRYTSLSAVDRDCNCT